MTDCHVTRNVELIFASVVNKLPVNKLNFSTGNTTSQDPAGQLHGDGGAEAASSGCWWQS